MSGICAAVRKVGLEPIDSIVASVTTGLGISGKERITRSTNHVAGAGVSAVFPTQQIYQSSRLIVVCDATLFDGSHHEAREETIDAVSDDNATAALIGRLYERFGCGFVRKLSGTFSLIIWDLMKRQMIAAVDGFGVNRLVYFHNRDIFLISSRIDSLLRSSYLNREVNPRAIANVLNFSANLGPETIFTGVHRLLPGTMLIASEARTVIAPFWDMHYAADHRTSANSLAEELHSLVRKSVSAHLPCEKTATAGAFLSGGTDSSTIVGMMSQVSDSPVKTFSIGFQEHAFNELAFADIAARTFKAEHHTLLVRPQDCLDALPRMVKYFDEPFGNSSSIPTYFCARLAAENGVTTLLAGDGGDELFAGNEWYLTDKIFEAYQAVPSLLRHDVIEPVLTGLPAQNALVSRAQQLHPQIQHASL